MRRFGFVRGLLAMLLSGAMLTSQGCGPLIKESVRDGLLTWVTGSVASSLNDSAINNLLLNLFTGGFTGGLGNNNRL